MEDVFSLVVSKLLSLGFFNFLTFILALVLVYALLKQRKIFGENPVINGLIAFSIAFFVFAYPIISGMNLTPQFSVFFSQAFVLILIFFIGFLMASFFYPDIPKIVGEFFKSRSTLFGVLALSLVLFISSGLVSIIYNSLVSSQQQGGAPPPTEITLLFAGLIIAIVVLLISSSVGKGGW